jgi:transcription-repair coupling factor (superfamily II helicase)
MSLAGLLTILDADPQLHDVVARVDHDSAAGDGLTGATLAGEDLVAPPSLRPVLAAALTRRAQRPGGFVLAVTATAREADDLVAGLGSFLPPAAVAVTASTNPRDPGARRVSAAASTGRSDGGATRSSPVSVAPPGSSPAPVSPSPAPGSTNPAESGIGGEPRSGTAS